MPQVSYTSVPFSYSFFCLLFSVSLVCCYKIVTMFIEYCGKARVSVRGKLNLFINALLGNKHADIIFHLQNCLMWFEKQETLKKKVTIL